MILRVRPLIAVVTSVFEDHKRFWASSWPPAAMTRSMALVDGSLNSVSLSSVRAASWIVVIPELSHALKPRPCPTIRRLTSEFADDGVSAVLRHRRPERPIPRLVIVSFGSSISPSMRPELEYCFISLDVQVQVASLQPCCDYSSQNKH